MLLVNACAKPVTEATAGDFSEKQQLKVVFNEYQSPRTCSK